MIPKEVTVARSHWYRGRGWTGSLLRLIKEKKTMMCCLGFVARASTCSSNDILDIATPAEVSGAREKMPQLVTGDGGNTITCDQMMDLNDSEHITEAKREEGLCKLAEKAGFKFKFID